MRQEVLAGAEKGVTMGRAAWESHNECTNKSEQARSCTSPQIDPLKLCSQIL